MTDEGLGARIAAVLRDGNRHLRCEDSGIPQSWCFTMSLAVLIWVGSARRARRLCAGTRAACFSSGDGCCVTGALAERALPE